MNRVGLRVAGWVVGLAAVGVGFGASGGIAAATPKPVPATTYVQTVCTAAAQSESQAQALNAPAQQANQALQAQPSAATAAQYKSAILAYFKGTLPIIDGLLPQWRAAGVPDVKNGAAFAKAAIGGLAADPPRLRDEIAKIQKLDVSSPARFVAAFMSVTAKFDAQSASRDRKTLANPVIKNAPSVLQPVVVYVTTSATACPVSTGA